MNAALQTPVLADLVARALAVAPADLRIDARPLRGGLESGGVFAVVARYHDHGGRERMLHAVAKVLDRRGTREPAVYASLGATRAGAIAPRVLGAHFGPGGGLLLLEHLRQARAWPWTDTAHAAEVLRSIALLHGTPAEELDLPPWDYEGELAASAAATLDALRAAHRAGAVDTAGAIPAVRRLVGELAAFRRALLQGPLAPAALHGDLHSGNVVVRRTPRHDAASRIGLIDWQRARVGSALEDVSSFLQSLAYWEPRVRSRHDTLLGDYLEARGLDRRPTRDLRDAYWLAAASNALAGALMYQLAVATADGVTDRARSRAAQAARDWLRIVRRADAVWSGSRQAESSGVLRPFEPSAPAGPR